MRVVACVCLSFCEIARDSEENEAGNGGRLVAMTRLQHRESRDLRAVNTNACRHVRTPDTHQHTDTHTHRHTHTHTLHAPVAILLQRGDGGSSSYVITKQLMACQVKLQLNKHSNDITTRVYVCVCVCVCVCVLYLCVWVCKGELQFLAKEHLFPWFLVELW